MERLKEIDSELDVLKRELETVTGTQTEVYTRIVGYYRSVRNWNKGKKEEYGIRQTFEVASSREIKREEPAEEQARVIEKQEQPKIETAENRNQPELFAEEKRETSYSYFFRQTCPNCPPVKEMLESSSLTGRAINVDSESGLHEAGLHNVYSAPTVIIFDGEGKEVHRAVDATSLKEYLEPKAAIA